MADDSIGYVRLRAFAVEREIGLRHLLNAAKHLEHLC